MTESLKLDPEVDPEYNEADSIVNNTCDEAGREAYLEDKYDEPHRLHDGRIVTQHIETD